MWIDYGKKPRLRRTLDHVKLVVTDGREAIVVLFNERTKYNKSPEVQELTKVYTSLQEVDNFLFIWAHVLDSVDVFNIRRHLSENISTPSIR